MQSSDDLKSKLRIQTFQSIAIGYSERTSPWYQRTAVLFDKIGPDYQVYLNDCLVELHSRFALDAVMNHYLWLKGHSV